MILNIGDKVFAKTDIMRCAILGTIRQEDDARVLVVFDHPVRGVRSAWVERSVCEPVKPPTHIEIKNRKIKNESRRVIGGLEVVK